MSSNTTTTTSLQAFKAEMEAIHTRGYFHDPATTTSSLQAFTAEMEALHARGHYKPPCPTTTKEVSDFSLRLLRSSTPVYTTAASSSSSNVCKDEEKNECAICRDELVSQAVDAPFAIKLKGCGHTLHYECMLEWVDVRSTKVNCPFCRGNVFSWRE